MFPARLELHTTSNWHDQAIRMLDKAEYSAFESMLNSSIVLYRYTATRYSTARLTMLLPPQQPLSAMLLLLLLLPILYRCVVVIQVNLPARYCSRLPVPISCCG